MRHLLILLVAASSAFLQSCSTKGEFLTLRCLSPILNEDNSVQLTISQGRTTKVSYTCYPSKSELVRLSQMMKGYKLEENPLKWEIFTKVFITTNGKTRRKMAFYHIFNSPENIAFKVDKRYYCGKNVFEVEKLFLSMSKVPRRKQ